jgi:hypothetical protein
MEPYGFVLDSPTFSTVSTACDMPLRGTTGEKMDWKRETAKLRTTSKNAQNPQRPVHLRMMAGDHFPPKNVFLSTQRKLKKLRFLRKMMHFSHFSGDVLRTQ